MPALSATKEFHAAEWSFDPFAKSCERCDAVIGRYAVMVDDDGLRHVLFWPHQEWDGVEGSARCRIHSKNANNQQQWLRLF